MKRLIIAAAVLATLVLAAPQAHAGGLFGGLFRGRRQPVQRNFSIGIGGGRGLSIQRQVVRGAAPVVVQQPAAFQVVQQKRIVQQQFAVPVYQQQVQVQQQFRAQQFGVAGY